MMHNDEPRGLSVLAWRILTTLAMQTQAEGYERGVYFASWTLGERTGGDATSIDPIALKYTPRTPHDKAMRELVDLGLIEELPDLPCRYRLVTHE